ncbi:hypothetical protein AYK26_00055 [Euryarchaeota archaeon SM23-78]|nr:MAG: hypothetical protein AYK26_00055 [Euryarchaeota archaeon SM23-78]MBW3000530.1 radical SAM protein [Candidatus Woesearchaeota archaeon]
MQVKKTKYYSCKAGRLARGCQLCVKGEKLVLFVTGLCSSRCDFCPLSDKKLYKDVVYANEMPVTNINQIIKEAKLCDARGAGITGGDPLTKLWRTCFCIRKLKKGFGKNFHIHLYTPLTLVNKNNLKQLYKSGLNEIRFHPKLDNASEWKKIELAKEFDWKIGVEIPAIPGKENQTKKLIDFIKGKVDFLNINELELADNAVWRRKKNIKCKDNISYAIKGSEELAKKLLKYAAQKNIPTHYCTCKLKDKVQLAKRILRRANNVKEKFDTITKEGLLIRGALYPPELVPGFGYHDKLSKLKKVEKKKVLNNLKTIRNKIIRAEKIKAGMIKVDENKLRLITSKAIVKKIKNKDLIRAIVTEYPTFDALELEVELI